MAFRSAKLSPVPPATFTFKVAVNQDLTRLLTGANLVTELMRLQARLLGVESATDSDGARAVDRLSGFRREIRGRQDSW